MKSVGVLCKNRPYCFYKRQMIRVLSCAYIWKCWNKTKFPYDVGARRWRRRFIEDSIVGNNIINFPYILTHMEPDVTGRQIHFVFTWGDIFLCIFGSMKKTGVLNCWLSYGSRYSASPRSICLALYNSPTSSCNISAVSFVLSYSSFM